MACLNSDGKHPVTATYWIARWWVEPTVHAFLSPAKWALGPADTFVLHDVNKGWWWWWQSVNRDDPSGRRARVLYIIIKYIQRAQNIKHVKLHAFAREHEESVISGTAAENTRTWLSRQLCTQYVEDIYRSNYPWPWNLDQGSLKVTGNGTIG